VIIIKCDVCGNNFSETEALNELLISHKKVRDMCEYCFEKFDKLRKPLIEEIERKIIDQMLIEAKNEIKDNQILKSKKGVKKL